MTLGLGLLTFLVAGAVLFWCGEQLWRAFRCHCDEPGVDPHCRCNARRRASVAPGSTQTTAVVSGHPETVLATYERPSLPPAYEVPSSRPTVKARAIHKAKR